MHGTHQSSLIRNAVTLMTVMFLVSACLMDEEESTSDAEIMIDHEVSGSVGDGPVIGATMRILRNDGVELMQLDSDANASYNITVRTKGKYYPLGIDARNGTDIVTNTAPDFDLLSAVFEPGNKSVANVNPFSTFAVELARDLSGGVNKANLATAQGIVSSAFNNGLASLKTSGAMTTKIDGSNIAEMVRASEALGETVRRTRDALAASGFATSANNIVRALSSDLTNNVVDGIGGPRTDARVAAVAVIVSAQVLLETMANELHVNGADATALMSNAINQVSLEAADPRLEDLTVTADMLTRARVGIVAAHAITSDTAIAGLLTDVEGVQTGAGSSTVRNFALPSDYRSRLDNAVLLAAGGSSAVVTTVNDISRDGTQTIGGENRAPNISGTPAGSVEVDSAYSFTPSASDPDNDTLTFSVTGEPSWASIDSVTGEFSGTPTAAGVHNGIVISVSDGELSASLPAFSITVNDVAVNSPPVISGDPPAEVNVDEPYSFTPTASDPDSDDTLTFTESGLPLWLSLNESTGEISGTPAAGDVGEYTDISITVSDGQAEATLGPFTITVQAVSLGSVTLTWTAPTQNEDGTTLTDLDGYIIFWGTEPDVYPNSERIENESVTTYVVEGLAPGTYRFAAKSFNTAQVESRYSGVAIKVVP